MSVHKEPNGTYTVRVQLPRDPVTGKRSQYVRKGFETKRDAERQERLALGQRDDRGIDLTGGTITFGAFLADWLNVVDADPRLKATTRAHYRRMARHLAPLAKRRLDKITGSDLTLLYAEMRKAGLSETTIHHVHVTARKALGTAKRLIPFNPAEDAIAPAQRRPEPKSYKPEQVRAFLDLADTDRWAALWRLAALTGARRGELVGMHWSDLDLDEGTWTLRRNAVVVDHAVVETTPKSGKPRVLALDPQTVAGLRAWRKHQAEERLQGGGWEHDLVWTWQDGGRLHPDTVSRTFGRLRAAAGLPRLTLHNLRHSYATNALASGLDPKVVSVHLGHSSERITRDMYQEVRPEHEEALSAHVAALYG